MQRLHAALTPERGRAPQHLEQQGAEGEDVAARVDRAAAHLLGRHVRRGAHDAPGVGLAAGGCVRVAVHDVQRLPQLGQAEVDDLGAARVGDHDVGRLEVAVDHQIGMRVSDGVEDVDEQADPAVDVEGEALAVAVDVLAFDVLEDQVGLAHRGHAGIDQVRDVRVGQLRQDAALAREPLFAGAADERDVQQLHRSAALVAAVAALGQPHRAHAAAAERRDQRVGADAQPLLRRLSSRLFNLLTATVLLGQWRDTQCGLKAFRSDAARRIFERTRLDGFAFDVEVLHLVERFRLSLAEVPVTVSNDERSTVRVGPAAASMIRDLWRVRGWAAEGFYDRPN